MLAEIYVWFFCLQLIFAAGETQGVDGQLHLRYVGCFKGNGSSQVNDSDDTPLQKGLTIDQCIRKCHYHSSSRMTFAGLSNGNICVCSDHFGLQVSETECNMKCTGSDNQYCGGVYTRWNPIYSVYAVCEIGSYGGGCKQQCHCKDQLACERRTGLCQSGCEAHWSGISCNKSKVDIKNEYIGCFKDNAEAAMDEKNPGNKTGSHSNLNSVEFCIEICSSFNYSYAGMQYAYDCNCGEQYDKYGTSLGCVSRYSCLGNISQICGGNFANSVYHACPTGFYGRNCTNRCNCANGTRCSKSGCPSGRCKSGWKGTTCSNRDCLDNNGDCGPYQQCKTIDLGYTSVNECRCKDDYVKLGSKCFRIQRRYIGCFRGNISSKPSIITNDQLTIDICLTWCHQLNKTYIMLKTGKTCLCEDSLRETTINPDENCNEPCSGNQNQYCGMKDNMDSGYAVYAVTDDSWRPSHEDCGANEFRKEINLGFIKIKRCRCMEGFEQKDPWDTCKDVDECLNIEKTCPNAFNCTNTIGSFHCSYCSDGLIVDNGTCINSTSTHYVSQDEAASIIGGILGFVAIVIFIIIIVFLTTRKRKSRKRANKTSVHQAVLYTPDRKCANHDTKPVIELLPANAVCTNINEVSSKIRVKDFPDHLKRKRAIIGNLEKEFQSIPLLDETKPIVVGKKMPKKNRFKNILPCRI